MRVESKKAKLSCAETRVSKTNITIPKLPPMESFLDKIKDDDFKNKINHIFDKDKKLSIDKLIEGPTKKT